MSTSCARPDDLDAFATGSRAADDELRTDANRLVGGYNDFLGGTSWGYFDIQSLLGGFGEYIGWNETDARWVSQIAAAFAAPAGTARSPRCRTPPSSRACARPDWTATVGR